MDTLNAWRKVTGAGESLCDAEHVAYTAWLFDLPTPVAEVAA